MSSGKVAVVLFQLGGPDAPEAVEPFLYNLFRDPDIIDFPGAFLARKPLARLIARKRARTVAEHYRELGGKSPINDLTGEQARALGEALAPRVRATVLVGMRYWKPFIADAARAVRDGGFDRLVLLPLYPHYSRATTLSSFREWGRQLRRERVPPIRTGEVCCYFNHPRYIRALIDNVGRTLRRFEGVPAEEIDLLFSAHGIPVSLVEGGDPYKLQIEETVRLVAEGGAWGAPRTICYQSRIGPSRWLGPTLEQAIAELARRGRRNLLVVPVSFVTDHIETLHEIDMEARAGALRAGIERFEMVPGLNSDPGFIGCLAEIVEEALVERPSPLPSCRGVCERARPSHEPTLCPHWNSRTPLRP